MRSAINRAKRRGRLGLWQRRLTITALSGIAVGASYFFTIDKASTYQHLVGGLVGFIGFALLVIDWFVSRNIERSGGLQAIRSGGTLSTGPSAFAGRTWAQGEGFRICGLPDDARKTFSEAASLAREAKQDALEATVKLSQGELAGERAEFDDAARYFDEASAKYEAAKDNRGGSPEPLPQKAFWPCPDVPMTRRARTSRKRVHCLPRRTIASDKATPISVSARPESD